MMVLCYNVFATFHEPIVITAEERELNANNETTELNNKKNPDDPETVPPVTYQYIQVVYKIPVRAVLYELCKMTKK